MIAFLSGSTWTRWTNQPRPLNGDGSYQLPRNAEAIYADAELAAYGLVRVTLAEVPAGKRVVFSSLVDQDGAPAEQLELEDVVVTDAEVNDERTRRLGLPLPVTVTGIGTITIDMTDQSRANITGLTVLAQLRLAQGDTGVMTSFRDADNVDHDITPAQAIEMGVQAAEHVDVLYKASWAIKALTPVPLDFADDAYWMGGQ